MEVSLNTTGVIEFIKKTHEIPTNAALAREGDKLGDLIKKVGMEYKQMILPVFQQQPGKPDALAFFVRKAEENVRHAVLEATKTTQAKAALVFSLEESDDGLYKGHGLDTTRIFATTYNENLPVQYFSTRQINAGIVHDLIKRLAQ